MKKKLIIIIGVLLIIIIILFSISLSGIINTAKRQEEKAKIKEHILTKDEQKQKLKEFEEKAIIENDGGEIANSGGYEGISVLNIGELTNYVDVDSMLYIEEKLIDSYNEAVSVYEDTKNFTEENKKKYFNSNYDTLINYYGIETYKQFGMFLKKARNIVGTKNIELEKESIEMNNNILHFNISFVFETEKYNFSNLIKVLLLPSGEHSIRWFL